MWINCAREDIFLVLLVYCQTILSLSGLCFESNPILRSTLCLLPFVCSVMDHFPVDWLVCLCSVFNWMGRSSVAQSPFSHMLYWFCGLAQVNERNQFSWSKKKKRSTGRDGRKKKEIAAQKSFWGGEKKQEFEFSGFEIVRMFLSENGKYLRKTKVEEEVNKTKVVVVWIRGWNT